MSGSEPSRRTVLEAGAGGTLAAALAARPTAATPAPRPNILWLISEDNNP